MPLKQNIIKSSIYSAFAAASYLIRIDARENGNEYFGGILGGSLKYGLRTAFVNMVYPDNKLDTVIKFNNEIIFKSQVGAANNLAYEICNNNEICSNNVPTNVAFATFVETTEGIVSSMLKGAPVTVKDTIIGLSAGAIGGMLGNYVYAKNIDIIHQTYDSLEDFISYPMYLPNNIITDPLSIVNDFVNELPYGQEIASACLYPFVLIDMAYNEASSYVGKSLSYSHTEL
jgi:hypothetical protein